MSRITGILEPYKVHHKDLDVCFNDAVAVHHVEQAITDLLNEAIGEDETDTKHIELANGTFYPKYNDGYECRNELRHDIRTKLGLTTKEDK